jgi:hypothetical protein
MALPEPEGGLVISYSYLWRHESEAGQVEGVKDRPCAVIVVVHQEDGTNIVTVAPITHTPPSDRTVAIEIPPRVKQYLGLDSDRSWVRLDDFNEFAWPGYDLRPVPGKPGRYDYGFLPPSFYRQIVTRTLELRREGRMFVFPRIE